MKKYLWIFALLVIIIIVITFYNKNITNRKQEETYIAEKTSKEIDYNEGSSLINNIEENLYTKKSEELSEYSTTLPKDTKERYTNIALACNTLNGTIIKSGEIFSLWNVLGCPTKEKGYEKAKTFSSGGKIILSYGGGICQVSTTIYNAANEVEGLEIVERHEHSRDVSYIEDGKDASVSYNTADFRFKNVLEYDVKMEAKLEDNQVIIKLIRI